MGYKKVTISDIAKLAGVSTATVSHAINRTRYVNPELVQKIEQIIRETGYVERLSTENPKIRKGKQSLIVGVFPNWKSVMYHDMAVALNRIVLEKGYQFWITTADDDPEIERQLLESMMIDKTVAGVFLVPMTNTRENYKKFVNSRIPLVCMERHIPGVDVETVAFRERSAIYRGTNYLIECGHKNLLFFRETTESVTREEQTRGYLEALKKINCNENDANIEDIDLHWTDQKCQEMILRALDRTAPTAVIAGGNRMTMHILTVIKNIGIRCPEELSLIGFGDAAWAKLMDPPLTTLERDVNSLSAAAADILLEKIEKGTARTENDYVDVNLVLRKSTRMLDNGPFGETAVSPDSITFSSEEIRQLRTGKFRVAISFHYTGTAWAELHEMGIREELGQYGIDVISVMDAHFDPELQNMQLEAIRVQNPDAVIAIPADDKNTAAKFQELSKTTKLVFISNIPEGIGKNSYVSCVSVNEWENGTNVGRMMGEYFSDQKGIKVGFINHGATFYATRERDGAARKIIDECYPQITVVSSKGFGRIDNAYQVCRDMIRMNPEISALYVSWDRPALQVLRALKEMGREDISVFTTDLDREIVQYMQEGMVKGLSTQRPYEQGKAVAQVVAKSLVSEQVPKYVGVQPYLVEAQGLKRAWRDIFHKPM